MRPEVKPAIGRVLFRLSQTPLEDPMGLDRLQGQTLKQLWKQGYVARCGKEVVFCCRGIDWTCVVNADL